MPMRLFRPTKDPDLAPLAAFRDQARQAVGAGLNLVGNPMN
jgi:hypothetical protein